MRSVAREAEPRAQGEMAARARFRLVMFFALWAFPRAAGAHLAHTVRGPGAHSAAVDVTPPHALDGVQAHRPAPALGLKTGSPWCRRTRVGAPQGSATKYILLGTGALEAVDRLSRSQSLLRAPIRIRGWIIAPESCPGESGSAQTWKVRSVSGARAVYSDGRAHNLMALESVALPEMQCTGPGLLLVGQCGSDAVSLSPAVIDALEDRLCDDTTSVVAALNPEVLEHAAPRIDWTTCRICHIGGGSVVQTELAATAAAAEGVLEFGGSAGGPLAIESWDSVASAVQSLVEELGMGQMAEDMKGAPGTHLSGYAEGQVPEQGVGSALFPLRGRDVKRTTRSRSRGLSHQSQPVSPGPHTRSRSLQGCVQKRVGSVKRKVPSSKAPRCSPSLPKPETLNPKPCKAARSSPFLPLPSRPPLLFPLSATPFLPPIAISPLPLSGPPDPGGRLPQTRSEI